MIMEYVDGEPVLGWAERTSASIRERLDQFQSLCSAVRFAHQNLIIHRDITPSNVLVNKDGQVKLIDFGISRSPDQAAPARFNPPGSKTATSYTPGYAAPERSGGAVANTLSDVYSLGRLLSDILKPETTNPELAAIISCATADEPHARYASVDALNEDVSSYRAGKPVSAFGGSAPYRFRKFVGRHRLAVASIAAVILGLSATLAGTLIQYNRAEAALAVANDRFTQARELSRTLVFDVYDETQKISGSLEARKALAGVVRDYVSGLELDEKAPEDVLVEVGIITSRLADLYGGVGIANLGENEQSMALFLDAQKTLNDALARNPVDRIAIAELVMVERMLTMQHYHHKNDLVTAHAANQRALELAELGLALGPEGEQPLLRHLWSIRTDELQLLGAENRTQEALTKVRQWRSELTPEMVARIGSGGEMEAYFAMQEAMLLIGDERGKEALEPLETAISLRSQQLSGAPENYYFKTQLMVATGEMATASRLAGDLSKSRESAATAVSLAREIMAADPEDAGGPEGLSVMLQKLATAEFNSGNLALAKAAINAAAELLERAVAQFPGDTFYEVRLLNVLSQAIEFDTRDPDKSWSCGLIRSAGEQFDVQATLSNPEAGWEEEKIRPLLAASCGP